MATPDEIIKIKNELSELSNITRVLAKDSINDLNVLMASYEKLFDTSNENLVKLLESSADLRNVYAELQDKIAKGAEAIREVNEDLKTQREEALIDEKTQLEIIKDMQKQKRILNELAELNNKLNDASLSLNNDEIDKIKDRIILLDNENKLITNTYNSKKAGHLNEYRYAMELSTTHSATLDKLDDINKLQEKAAINAKEYANESERAKKALEKQDKIVAGVVEGAKALWTYAVKLQNSWADFNDAAVHSGRAIGMNRDQIENYQRTLMRNTKEFAAKYGVNEKTIIGFQNEYANSTARAIILTNDQTEAMTAMSKLAGDGITNQVAGELDNFGVSIEDAMVNLGITQERAMKYGLSASKSGELFSKNIKLASQYTFKSGVDGVSKMTLLSQKLKFNLDSISGAADNFSNIEGAIGTSAKLQMLGGSYASQFGNPMTVMYEAMNDFEAFTERVTDTFASKGVFNKKTGEVEIGSMDKRFIKESASALGISYAEAMNIAMSKVKISEIEGQINKGAGFNDANKAAIGNLATWDSTKMEHVINYIDENGEEQKKSVKNLDKETLDFIQRQTISDDAMQKDVRDIAKVITKRFGDRAKSTVSWRERKEGLSTVKKSMEAEGVDGIMTKLNNFLTNLTAGDGALNKFFTEMTSWSKSFVGASALFVTGTALYKTIANKSIGKMLGDRAARGVVNGTRRGVVGRTANRVANSRVGQAIGRNGGKLAKKGGKAALIGGGLLALGALLSSNSSSAEGYNANEELKDNNNISDGNDTVLNELMKQTRLLEIISGLKSKNTYNADNQTLSDNGDGGYGGAVAQVAGYSALGVAGSKFGRKALLKTGGKKGLGMAMGAGKMLKASNPYALGGLAIDGINFIGQSSGAWEEGSNTDKMMNVGSSAATGAGFGAAIGSVVPVLGTAIGAAIGGAIGGVVGIANNYGEDIKDWALGKDTFSQMDKVQEEYEETKFGATTISDPQLGEKAALATVKIHDILISMWHNMNGKQGNGIEKDNGFLGGATDFLTSAITMPFKIGSGIAKSTISSLSNPFSGIQDISPSVNSLNINPMISRPSVRSIASVGANSTSLLSNNMYNSNGYNESIKIPDINVNISGTLKLASDNKSVDVDVKKLLDNPQFKESLIKMVKDGLDRNQGLGKINRNNITSQRTSSGYKV